MKIYLVAFFNIMIVGNIYVSHKEYDVLQRVPQYESQESLDSFNDKKGQKNHGHQSSFFEKCDDIAISSVDKKRVSLIILVRRVSKIIISDKSHKLWGCSSFDKKNSEFQQIEAFFFKQHTNKDDEYTVEVDNQARKCIFPHEIKWKMIIDGTLFVYKQHIEDV